MTLRMTRELSGLLVLCEDFLGIGFIACFRLSGSAGFREWQFIEK